MLINSFQLSEYGKYYSRLENERSIKDSYLSIPETTKSQEEGDQFQCNIQTKAFKLEVTESLGRKRKGGWTFTKKKKTKPVCRN